MTRVPMSTQRSPARGGRLVAAGVGLLCGLTLLGQAVSAERSSRAAKSKTAAATASSDQADDHAVKQKLDELAAGQDKILKRLDEIMEELKVVKIRATLR